MSNDILKYHSDVKYYRLDKKHYYHTVIRHFINAKPNLYRTTIFIIILTMYIYGRIVPANAEVPDNSLNWQPQRSFADYDSKSFSQNISENSPTFGKVPTTIEVMPGQTVVLSCIVNNLGDRTVSWIRTADLQILTSGSITFTGDNRFSTEPTDDILSNCWGLVIRNVRYSDSGQYECQLNTLPKLKINVTLIVREQQLMDRPFEGTTIDGPRQQEIKPGSSITLTCRAIISIAKESENSQIKPNRKDGNRRSQHVIWSVNHQPITSQINRGGIYIYTDWSLSEVVSNLTLNNLTENDRGVYQCHIDDIGSDEIILHVMDDSKTAGSVNTSTSFASLTSSSLLLIIYTLVYVIVIPGLYYSFR